MLLTSHQTLSRRMTWAGHVARMGKEEMFLQGFGGETRGKENTWS